MNFRKGRNIDAEKIMIIIDEAKEALKSQGINQWQDGYPNLETIKSDLSQGEAYVLEDQEKIMAYVILSFGKEKTYNKIYEGHWLSEEEYAVIHRIAVSKESKGKGISHELLKSLEKITLENNIKSIKIDTHRQNEIMRKLLEKNNYKYCGIIYLEDGSERIAFEKILI